MKTKKQYYNSEFTKGLYILISSIAPILGVQEVYTQKRHHFETLSGPALWKAAIQLKRPHRRVLLLYLYSCFPSLWNLAGARNVSFRRKVTEQLASDGFDNCYVIMYVHYAHHLRHCQSHSLINLCPDPTGKGS